MPERVIAVQTISFTDPTANDGRNDILTWRVDDRPPEEGGLNGGETSFRPGDTVYLLLYRSPSVTLDTTGATDGSLSANGSGTHPQVDRISVQRSRTANLTYPAASVSDADWLGSRAFDDDGGVITPAGSLVNDSFYTFAESVSGKWKVVYTADYAVYRLSGVPLDVEEVDVFAFGTVTT